MGRQSLLTVTILATMAVAARADDMPQVQRFEVQYQGNLTVGISGQKNSTPAMSRLRYTLKRSGEETLLAFEELERNSKVNGKVLTDMLLTRNRFRSATLNKTDEFERETAPEAVKKAFEELFGSAVCSLRLDENGKELQRKLLAGPAARRYATDDLIDIARLFHAPFFGNKDKWESTVAMGGQGTSRVSGVLTYEKDAAKQPEGLIRVNVRGELKSAPTDPVRFKFVVSGDQRYDLKLKEWTSGTWKMETSGEGEVKGTKVDSVSGETVASMRRIPDSEKLRSFEISADAVVEGTQGQSKATGQVRAKYAYNHREDASFLYVNEIDMSAKVDDGVVLEMFLNRNQLRIMQKDKKSEFPYEKAPEKIANQIEQSCRLPIVKFRFDANGRELERTNIAGPEAKSLAQDGMIANFRMFHLPYFADRNKWEATVAINSGPSALTSLSTGTLTVEKDQAKKNERLVTVKVRGALSTNSINTATIKNMFTRHEVMGEQSYDPVLREWIRGEWRVTMKILGEVDGKQVERASGKLTLTLKFIETQ